ncbi:hypothetical protein [Neisseria yangbaofengii]|uniref:hypothetical protein n=1 Tax=Neisseria yangbaofengii TaxID=2709396 RepID=UPI001981478E|nr:hypothetical protein [Neisseria yangbaofengii]
MDELIATLSDGRTGESRWLETAEELIKTVGAPFEGRRKRRFRQEAEFLRS